MQRYGMTRGGSLRLVNILQRARRWSVTCIGTGHWCAALRMALLIAEGTGR